MDGYTRWTRHSEEEVMDEDTQGSEMPNSSDPTRMDQVYVLKCHPWIGMLTHTVLEDL